MLKKVLIGVVAVIAVFLVVVAMKPSDFRVERSIEIAAPADVVFEQVNDFHAWQAWSPWAKLDPSAENHFEGNPTGVGARFSWSGNDKVGAGKMTILESQPKEHIRILLEFTKPMTAVDTAEFTFKPQGDNTVVTWAMFGKASFMHKFFCMFMNMDKVVGGEFEKGLAAIKAIAESKK